MKCPYCGREVRMQSRLVTLEEDMMERERIIGGLIKEKEREAVRTEIRRKAKISAERLGEAYRERKKARK